MIFIAGAPRSGTSWLAKIFDSHPSVLYRHEPDSVIRSARIPPFDARADDAAMIQEAHDYLAELAAAHTIKVVGTVPHFPKSYRGLLAQTAYKLGIVALKTSERLPLAHRAANAVPAPELIRGEPEELVIKSINALGRLELFLTAAPRMKSVVIVRHPCGHIASILRGIRLRKYQSRVPITEDMGVYRALAETRQARRQGLDLPAFETMKPVERLAWRWALTNEMALDAAEASDRARVVRYEDLCRRPVELAQDLFAFAGLDWNPQSEAFLRASTAYKGAERFYQVFRDPERSANKWRHELSDDEQSAILSAVEHTPAWALFDHATA